MKCELCQREISKGRLEALPDTKLCVKCSSEIGSDYTVAIVEENLGSSIISKPMIHKRKNRFIKM